MMNLILQIDIKRCYPLSFRNVAISMNDKDNGDWCSWLGLLYPFVWLGMIYTPGAWTVVVICHRRCHMPGKDNFDMFHAFFVLSIEYSHKNSRKNSRKRAQTCTNVHKSSQTFTLTSSLNYLSVLGIDSFTDRKTYNLGRKLPFLRS